VNITAIYTTQLKAALGKATESIELADDATIGTLIAALTERHGDDFTRFVLDQAGNLLPSIILCIGDEQVAPGNDTPLADGDSVTFLSAISGG
jgi:molybdopterin converting factor small subunit